MLKLNKTLIILSGSVLGLIGILSLSPADWPANTHDRKIVIPEPTPFIGNLGGYPVLLPNRMVHLVEYDDSPGFDPEKIRNYNPPPRTYDSVIESFGYYVRYPTGEIKGYVNDDTKQFTRAPNDPKQEWVSVGVSSGKYYLNKILQNETNVRKDKNIDLFRYFYLNEKQFDLDIYAQMNVDPDTGRPFRETPNQFPHDLFIYKDKNGNTITYIRCNNFSEFKKTCQHFFHPDGDIKIRISAQYSRENLEDWRKIEKMIQDSIEVFKVN